MEICLKLYLQSCDKFYLKPVYNHCNCTGWLGDLKSKEIIVLSVWQISRVKKCALKKIPRGDTLNM